MVRRSSRRSIAARRDWPSRANCVASSRARTRPSGVRCWSSGRTSVSTMSISRMTPCWRTLRCRGSSPMDEEARCGLGDGDAILVEAVDAPLPHRREQPVLDERLDRGHLEPCGGRRLLGGDDRDRGAPRDGVLGRVRGGIGRRRRTSRRRRRGGLSRGRSRWWAASLGARRRARSPSDDARPEASSAQLGASPASSIRSRITLSGRKCSRWWRSTKRSCSTSLSWNLR